MKLSNEHLQNVLNQLYKAYPKSFETKELSLLITGEEKDGETKGACLYLKDKGLVVESNQDTWQISALGTDKSEHKPLYKGYTPIEKMLEETVVLVAWCSLASLFFREGYYKVALEITLTLVGFINSYGTKKDQELLKKISGLIKSDKATRKEKKNDVRVEMEAGEATKNWVGGLLKDIGQRLEEQEWCPLGNCVNATFLLKTH